MNRAVLLLAASVALLALSPKARAAEDATPPHLVMEVGTWIEVPNRDPEYWVLGGRASWQPVPWIGLAAEGEVYLLYVVPLGVGLRAGPILRPWALAPGRVTPFVTGQVGLSAVTVPDLGADARWNVRGEAGLDVCFGKSMMLTIGGGAFWPLAITENDGPAPFVHVMFGIHD